jgi:hypothetical protein
VNKPKGKNKHGLSRYIPEKVRETIRKNAGFGCVFCGCVLVEYEHIEPEFHDALEHDSERMTILCPLCHDKVTKKIISKKHVWSAKEKPKGLEQGYVNDMIFSKSDNLEFLLGNMRTQNMGIAISLFGKPLFWFEESSDETSPYSICCIFYGHDGLPIAYINRNEYIALVKNQDIVSVGTRLTISDKSNGCVLEISREGGEPLHIKKLYTQLFDTKIVIKDESSPVLFGNINTPVEDLGGFGSLTLAGQGLQSSAVALGGIPSRSIGNKLTVTINSILYGNPIVSESGQNMGWLLNGSLINFGGELVGTVWNGEAYSITGEFVSHYKERRLIYPRDQYDDGEPIFVKGGSRKGWAARSLAGYDLSHRFFGIA